MIIELKVYHLFSVKEWSMNKMLHRRGKQPAIIYTDGEFFYYKYDKYIFKSDIENY